MDRLVITNINGESITLGNQAPYYLEIIDGTGNVPVTAHSQKAPKQDGSTYIDNTLEARAISIEGMIITRNNSDEVQAYRRKMERVLNPKLGEVSITYYHKEDVIREIKGIPENTPIFPSGNGNKGIYYQKYLINLVCYHPFWKDKESTKEEAAIWRGEFQFPLEILMDTGIEMGFRIIVDVRLKELNFDVYEGRDLTVNQKINPPAILANEFENVFEQEYMESNNNFKNVALIAGEGEGVNRQLVTVGDANGLNRYELFVDARDLQSTINNDGEEVTIPANEYKELLINRARSKLLEHEKIETFESKINVLGNLRYKEDFDLGDIVTVTNKRWGVTKDSRITEVEEVYEANKTSINVTFGNSIPTLVDRIKQEVR